MRVHFDECKSTISLESGLNNVTKILEEGNEVVLSCVRREIANVASCLPLGGLLYNHVVALNSVSWEVMVAEWCGWGHSHLAHS